LPVKLLKNVSPLGFFVAPWMIWTSPNKKSSCWNYGKYF